MALNTVTEEWSGEIAEGAIDLENHVIRNVSLLGVKSRNRRRYPKEVMAAAAHLYEGANVNVDHKRDGEASRSIRDRIGIVRKVRAEGERLKGDFHYNPDHPDAKQFLWAVKNQPGSVGFSHVAMIKEKKVGKDFVVESIDSVKSVDLVADAATTNGVFEDTEDDELPTTGRVRSMTMLSDEDFAFIVPGGKRDAGGKTSPRSLRKFPLDNADNVRVALNTIPKMASWSDEDRTTALARATRAAARLKVKVKSQSECDAMEWDQLTVEEVQAKRPDLVELLVKESASASDLQASKTQISALKAKIAEFEKEKASREAREAIVAELKDAKLDPENKKHVGTAFRRALERCESKDERAELIEERVQELEDLGVLGEASEDVEDRDDRREGRVERDRVISKRREASESVRLKVADSKDFASQLMGRHA